MLAASHHVEIQSELMQRLTAARSRTDDLFELVKPEALYDRPIPERHRIIFYIGHLEAFDWNLLRGRLLSLESFHPVHDHLFAFGIDPVDGGLPTDQPADWPSVSEVKNYVKLVRAALDTGLEGLQLHRGGQNGSRELPPDQLLNVVIEHRLMHAETLSYMLHQLPLERKVRRGALPMMTAGSSPNRMIDIPGGTATLGLSR